MSIADKIIEKYRAGDSGSVADRIIRKFKGPSVQDRVKEARDKAEKYYQEAEDINNSFLVKGAELVNSLVGTTKAVGATAVDVLTPWDKSRTDSVQYKGVEYKTPGGKGAAGGARIAQGDVKGGLGEIGSGLLDVAQFIPVGGAVVRGATKATPIMQTLKGLGSVQGLKTAGMGLLKNKSVQQNAALMGGYGVTDAMQENQGLGGIALEGAKGVGLGAGLGLGFEGAGSLIGRAFTSLFEKIGTRPKRIVLPDEVKQVSDEISTTQGKPVTPEEENAILEALSNGATKEEVVDAVGMEKMMTPKPSLLEVEMTVEQNIGRQLDLEEKMTLKTDIDSGKPVEEIVQGFTAPKAPVGAPKTALKSPEKADTPETIPVQADNGDEAFLKAVEERFKASKTNKFRETKDEKGRFTGSTRESGDAARDELAEAIENRINTIPDNSVVNFGYREDLRAIQSKVAKAKPADLPALKAESDRIVQEILDARATKIRPIIAKDKKIAFTRTVANESDNFNEFQVNLKKRGEDITTIFKSKAAAEEFFNKNSSKPKYRVADEDPLLQEAGKYKSAEEFVKAQALPESRFEYHLSTDGKLPEGKTFGDLPRSSEAGIRGGSGDEVFSSKNPAIWHSQLGYEGLGKTPDNVYLVEVKNPQTTKMQVEGGIPKSLQTSNLPSDVRIVKNLGKVDGSFDAGLFEFKKEKALTDLYNKAQGSKFRDIGARFEELTGKKLSPAQEAQIKALHQKMFGDDGIEITAQILTPEGHKAFGVYKNKVIKILDGQADPTDTFYHEAVHKYLDLFTTLDEQKKIYVEARKVWKTDNLDELEEKIAENFIRYAKTNEGVVGTMKVLFDKVIERIKTAIGGESSIEALYKDILEGKAKRGDIEFLPESISVAEESRRVGAKRISPDRTAHQQMTPEEGKRALVESAKKKTERNSESWKKAADKIDALVKKYGDKLPVRNEANIKKYPELLNDSYIYADLKKYTTARDLVGVRNELLARAKRAGWSAEKEAAYMLKVDEEYKSLVKADISKGYRFPEAVLNYDKSFKTAVDSRSRYEKGLATSFSADDSRIIFDDVESIGAGMKRQDGKTIEPAQIKEIKEGVIDFANILGLDMKKLAENNRWVYVHLNGKNPFLMKMTAGLYREGKDSVSISVGGRESFEKIVDGKKVKEYVNTTVAHELGHAIDYKVKNSLFDSSLLWNLRKEFNPIEFSSRGNKYWGSNSEITARMVEQYVSVKKGSTAMYNREGYWKKEVFDRDIRPAVEKAIEKHFADYRLSKQIEPKQVEPPKKASVEPKKSTEEPKQGKTEAPKEPKKKTSVIASRLNEALPEGFKIDESYDPKVIKDEIDKAAQTISKDKEKAIQKAFDPNTNPVERDAILIELSEIAKREGDFGAVADLFQRRAELIRSGAQSLNMEKASILLNPQEKYMRDIVNSRLAKVKINGKDLTEVEVAAVRKTVRKETTEATKKAFKIQDAQELFNSLLC